MWPIDRKTRHPGFPVPDAEVLALPPVPLPPVSVTNSTLVTSSHTGGFITELCSGALTTPDVASITDEPSDPLGDFSGTTTKHPTRRATTTYNAPGQPGLQHYPWNLTTTGSKSGSIAESLPPLDNILLNEPQTSNGPSPENSSALATERHTVGANTNGYWTLDEYVVDMPPAEDDDGEPRGSHMLTPRNVLLRDGSSAVLDFF
ncbi:hypothetical protein HPB51_029688 [Rhipicephalus microplus]|uniref:Uncharacterized protein n=1 Tax=Rhipicephalus microplus TaxID=6941 RepID=A0A9J6CT37_RHIMP|nr:hypothetical protein HPB51_029688 [Rhipicephalus microplus]